MQETTVQIRPKGPYVIKGNFELLDSKGERFDLGDRQQILLCSCGASSNSPFCDGSHNRIQRDWDPRAKDLP